ncbi:cytochrome c biogenesis protein [Thermoflexus sp.]|uniref:cytochrome c biogenesis protein n=1 Tax=Thermoflexus sp. TaxID=1969742 RepID=UPI0035E40A8E
MRIGERIWVGATIALMVLATLAVFVYAPREAQMGDVQRIFYFHVSTAWSGFLAFAVALIGSIAYLRTRAPRWDQIGHAAVEVGLILLTMAIITGSLWARPVWNTWWTWDPRLTTTTITWVVYLAYLLLRNAVENPETRARFAAVYAIVAFVTVPITYLSARLLRTIHPIVLGPSVSSEAKGQFGLTPRMVHTMVLSLVAWTLLFSVLLWLRYRVQRAQEALEEMEAMAEVES